MAKKSQEIKTLIRVQSWSVDEQRRMLNQLLDREQTIIEDGHRMDRQLIAEQQVAAADPAQGVVWDLSPLYPDGATWQKERVALEADLAGVAALKGGLGASPQALRDGLNRISDLRRRVQRLDAYAQLKASEVVGGPSRLRMLQPRAEM